MNDLEKKVSVQKKDLVTFKSVSQMSRDELNELVPVTYSISRQERKKQKGSFSYTAHAQVKPGLGFDFYLEEAEFYLIQAEKKCKPGYNSYSFLKGVCQIFKGKRKNDDSIFYGIEVALTPKIFRSKYLSDSQVELLKVLNYKDLRVQDRTHLEAKEFIPFIGEAGIN